jgi:hypothetical protein
MFLQAIFIQLLHNRIAAIKINLSFMMLHYFILPKVLYEKISL